MEMMKTEKVIDSNIVQTIDEDLISDSDEEIIKFKDIKVQLAR